MVLVEVKGRAQILIRTQNNSEEMPTISQRLTRLFFQIS